MVLVYGCVVASYCTKIVGKHRRYMVLKRYNCKAGCVLYKLKYIDR